VDSAALPLPERYLHWVGIFPPSLIGELLTDDIVIDPVVHFQSHFSPAYDGDLIAQLLAVNMTTYLPGDLLVKTDRMTMANSLEARSPFLDRDLVEYAAALPDRCKLDGTRTKAVLRDAFRDLVPPEVERRGKMGFGVPLAA